MSNIEIARNARVWIIDNHVAIGNRINELKLLEGDRYADLLIAVTRIKFKEYKPRYSRSKVISHYKNNTIHFNVNKNISMSTMIENIAHESCHAIGMKHDAIKWYKRNRAEVMQSLVYRIGREIGGMYEE